MTWIVDSKETKAIEAIRRGDPILPYEICAPVLCAQVKPSKYVAKIPSRSDGIAQSLLLIAAMGGGV